MTVTRDASGARDLAGELVLLQLGSVPLFGGCDERQLADVAAVSGERRFAVGETVARAGTVVRDVPIVLDGYGGAEFDARPALVLGPGAVIGGPESLDGGLHPLTVVAQTPMIVRVVSAPDFADLIARVPPLAVGLIRQLGGRTRTVLDELRVRSAGVRRTGCRIKVGNGRGDRHRGSRNRLDTEAPPRCGRAPQLGSNRAASAPFPPSTRSRGVLERGGDSGGVTVAIASGARDDETIRGGIERWIRAHEPDGTDVVVQPLTRPAVGLSSDTSFVTAVTPSGTTRALVLRLPPAGDGLFPEYDLGVQVDRQEALRAVGIPTAPARYEPDPTWLGVPFMVMPRVAGAVLANNPSYLRAGWLVDGGADRQRHVLDAFLSTLAAVHRVEPAVVGAAPTTLTATVDDWCTYLEWAATGGPVPDYLARAREWCVDHVPAVDVPDSVLWGDVQMANCVFADTGGVAALLDFELTGSGPAEVDLGWFLALHDMTVATSGPDLPGFGDRASMLATYEAALGRPVAPLRWFEVFAMLRSGSIMVRIARLLAARGVDDSWLTHGNPTAAALAKLLASEE